MDMTDIKVHTTVPYLSGGDTQDGTMKHSLALTMIAERYPQQVWIQQRGRNTGPASHTDRKLPQAWLLKSIAPRFVQKQKALMQAASIVQSLDHDCKQVVSHCDALSVLQTYPNHMFPSLTRALQQAAAARRAVPQWIPAHCGMSGNEQGEILAKGNNMKTMSASAKRRLSSERSWWQGHRGMTVTCCPGSSKSFWWGFVTDITDWTVTWNANWS